MKRSACCFVVFSLFFVVPITGIAQECAESLFVVDEMSPDLLKAKQRFDEFSHSFQADNNVDAIFEVSLDGRSVDAIEKIVSDGQENYFVANGQARSEKDGFFQAYDSVDGEWKKTIKVTTHNFKGQQIVPYIQIFYEDKFGGVVRLKPYGNSDAPEQLTHLKKPHGTEYYKLDPAGDLSYENEAFKVYAAQALPKSPTQVKFPEGIEFGTPEAEEYLKDCWTFKTHVPLAE
ncbi:MAG: hypothetical protein ACU843_04385 [Gammaproteobacteria bacterium]